MIYDKGKETLFAEERKKKILDLLKTNDKVTVADLSKFFSVSSATIRNDLKELKNCNLLTRTHGGAMNKSKTSFENDWKNREVINLQEKKLIANAAKLLIEDGDTIILDTGTTTLELAKLLADKRDLNVITNDIEIARCLEEFDNVNIVFMGGIIRKKFHCTIGSIGIDTISEFIVDKAFIATNAFSTVKGAATPNINQADTKKSMISIAHKVIILCDSSKIGKSSFVQFADIQDIDIIVTDKNISEEAKQDLESKQVNVIIAD